MPIRKPISKEDLATILVEMFKRVGLTEEDYQTWDFSREGWYEDKVWTEAEQEDFQAWLGQFLSDHKYVGKRKYRTQNHGYYEAGKFIFQYGWKASV